MPRIEVKAMPRRSGAKSPKRKAQDLENELNWASNHQLVQVIASAQSDDHLLAIYEYRP